VSCWGIIILMAYDWSRTFTLFLKDWQHLFIAVVGLSIALFHILIYRFAFKWPNARWL
jgi:hypothetical protein